MRRIALCFTITLGLVIPSAGAAEARSLRQTYTDLYYAVAKKHGTRAPGRNIRRQGVRYRWVSTNHKGRHWAVRPATYHDYGVAIRKLRLVLHPPDPLGSLRATAECIGRHESGGDYRAVSSNGKYRGKYQFDYATFRAAGGHGDPAAASPAEQDAAFARYWPGHHRAWPNTSRMCGY